MLKKQELAQAGSCLNKAAPDEPVFVLRAKDPLASQAVRLWAAMAAGTHEDEKIIEAHKLADEMDEWHRNRFAETSKAVPLPERNRHEPWPPKYPRTLEREPHMFGGRLAENLVQARKGSNLVDNGCENPDPYLQTR